MSQLKSRPPVTRIVATAQPIRVIIVENHQLVSESLGLLLDAQRDMEVVGKATSVAGVVVALEARYVLRRAELS